MSNQYDAREAEPPVAAVSMPSQLHDSNSNHRRANLAKARAATQQRQRTKRTRGACGIAKVLGSVGLGSKLGASGAVLDALVPERLISDVADATDVPVQKEELQRRAKCMRPDGYDGQRLNTDRRFTPSAQPLLQPVAQPAPWVSASSAAGTRDWPAMVSHLASCVGIALERKPLILKSTFTDACIAELAKHFLNPREQRFVPDGRWVVETRQNGKFLTFTSFLVSFD